MTTPDTKPMQGLADYLRAQAAALSQSGEWSLESYHALRKWAADVDAATPAGAAEAVPVARLKVYMDRHDMGQSLAPNPPYKVAAAHALKIAGDMPLGEYDLFTAPPTPETKMIPDPGCTVCFGQGRYVIGNSGCDSDGNAPLWDDCDCFMPATPAQVAEAVPDSIDRAMAYEAAERVKFETWLPGMAAPDPKRVVRTSSGLYENSTIQLMWMTWIKRAILAGAEVGISASEAASDTEFCWLVELFLPEGNSLGSYHTGFTDLSGNSRSTPDPFKAKRYSKADAEAVAANLGHTLSGTWKAIEHGFATPPPAPQPSLPEQPHVYRDIFGNPAPDALQSVLRELDNKP